MASFEMNEDMIIEILSHTPLSIVQKLRTLNKECNERTYNSSFHKLHLLKTNSISGYFLQYFERLKVRTAFFDEEGSKISLDFLPLGKIIIEACDASTGLLLCVNDRPVRGRGPEYIICKPATKQYRIIPKPKNRYFTIALGLMVIGTNPLCYKILRLSKLPCREKRRYDFNFTLVCEVFDSDLFAWKRLTNVELPIEDSLSSIKSKPVASYGFLHWLTDNNNVFRFCFKTETWSIFSVPQKLASDEYLILVRYKGKLGVMNSRSKEEVNTHEVWVLENSLGNSWVNVKEFENIGLKPEGFLCNDVVTLVDVDQMDRICFYNMHNGKSKYLQSKAPNFRPSYYSTMSYFPFYSNYESVEFGGRSNGYQQDTPYMKFESQ